MQIKHLLKVRLLGVINRRMHPLKDTSTAKDQNWLKKFPTIKKQSIMIKYVKQV